MCLALPMQVIRMEGTEGGTSALCQGRNGIERMDTMLTGPLEAGQWVLVALESILHGDGSNEALIQAGFADLIDREPQLPEFLRPVAT
jgi:hydrogenase expression/formation protein HypC